MALAPGTRLGPYVVLAPLGAGGMGEVYRARDTRLGRDVAVKVLPESVAGDARALARLEMEARVLAALCHPSILALYDIGREGSVVYAVTELLEGRTLREALRAGAMSWREAAVLGAEIADGLEAAHAKGVVHRDLKPENVFVCDGGRMKILDFGLAKREASSPEATTESLPRVETAPGALVGTIGYVSPEQLHGRPVDHRADLFALGCVLHEMLSGRRAFRGATVSEVIAAILHDEPASLAGIGRRIPGALAEVVARCLRKDPSERFSTARDVALALRALASDVSISADARPGRLRLSRPALGLIAAVATGALLVAVWRSGDARLPAVSPRQVTSAAACESEPAISPDGEAVAYVAAHEGVPAIWVSDTAGGSPLRLTEGREPASAPAWFPDGKALLFVASAAGGPQVRKVARFGGPPQTLLADARDPAASPDGATLAFARADPDGRWRIWTAPIGRPERAKPLTAPEDGRIEQRQPAWAPDGRSLVYRDFHDLWVVPASGGAARRLTHDDPADFDPAFSPDGRHVYFTSYRDTTRAVWRVALSGGPPERVTFGSGAEARPSFSSDGRRLAYATRSEGHALLLVDTASGAHTRVEESRLFGFVALDPLGRFAVYNSTRQNAVDLWVLPLAAGRPAGEPRRLTDLGGRAVAPAVSPDGRFVAFYLVRDGQRDLFVVPASGGEPEPLAPHPASDLLPCWSPDGSRIVFVSDRGGRDQLWEVPTRQGQAAGEPRPLEGAEGPFLSPRFLPDGRSLVAILAEKDAGDLCLLDPAGGLTRLTAGVTAYQAVPTGSPAGLLVLAGWAAGRATIRSVPPDGGAPRAAAWGEPADPATGIYSFDATPDGALVALVEETPRGDVWVLEAQRGRKF